jgi:hypothetical protein
MPSLSCWALAHPPRPFDIVAYYTQQICTHDARPQRLGWITPQEGISYVGLPLGAVFWAAWQWGGRSWWHVFVPVSSKWEGEAPVGARAGAVAGRDIGPCCNAYTARDTIAADVCGPRLHCCPPGRLLIPPPPPPPPMHADARVPTPRGAPLPPPPACRPQIHTTMTIFILGHSGYHLTLDRAAPDALFLLLNPFQAGARREGGAGWARRPAGLRTPC